MTARTPSARPPWFPRLRKRRRNSVTISRREYQRLRNAADILDTVANLIRDILPEGD